MWSVTHTCDSQRQNFQQFKKKISFYVFYSHGAAKGERGCTGSLRYAHYSNITATLPDTNTYFPIYSGTHAADSTTTGWMHAIGEDAFFVVNSLTFTSVPESSSVTLLAVAFSALLICKRKCSQIPARLCVSPKMFQKSCKWTGANEVSVEWR